MHTFSSAQCSTLERYSQFCIVLYRKIFNDSWSACVYCSTLIIAYNGESVQYNGVSYYLFSQTSGKVGTLVALELTLFPLQVPSPLALIEYYVKHIHIFKCWVIYYVSRWDTNLRYGTY